MANYNAIRYNVPYSDTGAGSLRLIKTLTASSSSTLSFVDGSSDVVLDSTYKEYLFIFTNIHPETNDITFQFQVDTGTNTNYNQTITSSSFYLYHNEGDTTTSLQYITGYISPGSDAIDGVQFKFSGGQIQGGTIKMYGVS